MKAIMLASQHIQLNEDDIIIAGGMESMSNVPYYLKREDLPYGGIHLIDGILKDGNFRIFSEFFLIINFK